MIQHGVRSLGGVLDVDAELDHAHGGDVERLLDLDRHVRALQGPVPVVARPWRGRQIQVEVLRRLPLEGAGTIDELVAGRRLDDEEVGGGPFFQALHLRRHLHLDVELLDALQAVEEVQTCGRLLILQHPCPGRVFNAEAGESDVVAEQRQHRRGSLAVERLQGPLVLAAHLDRRHRVVDEDGKLVVPTSGQLPHVRQHDDPHGALRRLVDLAVQLCIAPDHRRPRIVLGIRRNVAHASAWHLAHGLHHGPALQHLVGDLEVRRRRDDDRHARANECVERSEGKGHRVPEPHQAAVGGGGSDAHRHRWHQRPLEGPQ
mmetsp:Transcript_171107/g.548363  ORF Transcript_171107/g.548363 Transcript_171107/m.548363 type:complete len:317 (-) Transcript_171107:6635-7585(-)